MVAHRPKAPEVTDADILNDEEEEIETRRRNTNAITHYRVLDRRNDAAFLECSALTGQRLPYTY